jgi:thioredoxin-related protein
MNKAMNKILYLLIILSFSSYASDDKRIKFKEGSRSKILNEANKQNKFIFIDIYAAWCGPCNGWMKNIFQNARVSEKFNKTFLNYKVDGDSFEGVNVGIIHRVESYPTYLFVAPNGKVIHRIEGTISPEGLVREADFVVNRASK